MQLDINIQIQMKEAMIRERENFAEKIDSMWGECGFCLTSREAGCQHLQCMGCCGRDDWCNIENYDPQTNNFTPAIRANQPLRRALKDITPAVKPKPTFLSTFNLKPRIQNSNSGVMKMR